MRKHTDIGSGVEVGDFMVGVTGSRLGSLLVEVADLGSGSHRQRAEVNDGLASGSCRGAVEWRSAAWRE
jgi:hypothetical protein